MFTENFCENVIVNYQNNNLNEKFKIVQSTEILLFALLENNLITSARTQQKVTRILKHIFDILSFFRNINFRLHTWYLKVLKNKLSGYS